MTKNDITIEGVPRVPGVTDTSNLVTTSFNHPKGFELPDFFESELYPRSAEVTGVGDLQDMSFVDGLTLTLSSRAEGAPPPIVVASYERDPGKAAGRVMNMEIDEDSNVLSYWETKSAYYDLTVWGTLPEDAWAIDISVAFSGSISLSSSD